MTIRRRIALSLLTVLLGCPIAVCGMAAGAASAESEPATIQSQPNTWHATTFVRAAIGLRFIHYWSKGSWMRAETMIDGHPIVTIVRGQDYIAFDELTGQGARIKRAPAAVAADARYPRPFGNELEELKAQGGVKVDEEMHGETTVEIWQKTDTLGRRKLWVTSDESRLPVRLDTFVRAGAQTITTNYSDWTRGLAIPDAFFEAAANVQLEELDYPSYVEAASTRPIGPILYPDLLHAWDIP